ncbi:MAG: beta-ketoacyl synthase N-terminal-like domain-containing protein, partial [Acidobacteriota bacterium]
LFSSLQSVLGDFGQADYAAANAFLDAFAQEQRRQGRPFMAIDWDNWQEVGIAVEAEVPEHLKGWREELLAKAIAPSEGIEVFERIMAGGMQWPRLVVSTQELKPRIELSSSFTGGRIVEELAGASPEKRADRMPALPAGSRREMERRIRAVWKSVLEVDQVGLHDNFFDLGGNSLTGLQLISELNRALDAKLSPVQLFEAPTPGAILDMLAPQQEDEAEAPRRREARQGSIAVIGMAGRFPGAENVEQLWENLCQGVESIRFFSDQELKEAGVPPELLEHPDYVKARPLLEGADLFDAAFFGISPREARITDPQQRVFLELCYQALEDAGQDPMGCQGPVGVYAGSSISSYLRNLYANPEFMRSVGDFQALIGNEKDSLPLRVSYKLNLRGPSLAVQTFCSTSLVAIHLACRSLMEGECDMALAGGVSIHFPQKEGYLYDESGGVSRDGHLRAFDAKASGYIFGSGAALVVLKPLEEALNDGDPIRAVIRGTSVTNDGALKAGYTATAVEGQSAAISQALARSGLPPQSIGYLECHGSGTPLGDPVEITALSRSYGTERPHQERCPIGSIKTNLGHLDRAAGAAGLIKAVLTLQRGKIPPSLHFEEPNPNIDFQSSPFAVNTELRDFPSNGEPRRAAVNSLGLGGTNAHVILEEAPAPQTVSESRTWQLLCLSARTDTALEAVTEQVAGQLQDCSDQDLPEIAYTLQTGRHAWESRRILVCRDRTDAAEALQSQDKRRVWSSVCRDESPPPVAFLLPGLGSQYPGMARELYQKEPVFRRELDRCAELLQPLLGENLLKVIYPPEAQDGSARIPAGSGTDLRRMLGRQQESESPDSERLNQTRLAQPAIFALEYSLAQLWMSWGIRPQALIGYSVGEYVAACLAGVLSLEAALKLVARRAQLIGSLPAGAMLSVPFSRDRSEGLLGEDLWLAAVNGPQQSVLAGSAEAVEALQKRLEEEGESCRRLQTTHAFHTPLLEPICEEITRLASSLQPAEPRIPCISNLTGSWMSADQATDPGYWAEHACRPVLFGQGIEEILKEPDYLMLEVGPGQTLGSLALQSATSDQPTPRVLASLRHSYETRSDQAFLLETLGKLWLLGLQPDWKGFYAQERRRKLALPSYPFERRRFWVDPAPEAQPSAQASPGATGQIRIYTPSWKRSVAAPQQQDSLERHWLIFQDSAGLGEGLAERLEEIGGQVSRVRLGDRLEETAPGTFTLDPSRSEDYKELLSRLGSVPDAALHLWGLEVSRSNGSGREVVQRG